MVIVDCHTGYRWLYGMKTRDEMLQVVRHWYCDIADLRQKHTLGVAMRDNTGENKSKEIMEFFYSVGVRNHFSTSHEQWQNGLDEAAINSIMRLARTVIAESGLGERFWFKATCAGKDARNVTYKQRLGSMPYTCMLVKSRPFQDSAHSDAWPGSTSTRKGGRRESIHPGR